MQVRAKGCRRGGVEQRVRSYVVDEKVTILGHVQNPAKCDKIEDLGQALEDWLTRKRQYEEFTDRAGNQCRVSEDSLMAAMYKLMPKSLEETVMFKSDLKTTTASRRSSTS